MSPDVEEAIISIANSFHLIADELRQFRYDYQSKRIDDQNFRNSLKFGLDDAVRNITYLTTAVNTVGLHAIKDIEDLAYQKAINSVKELIKNQELKVEMKDSSLMDILKDDDEKF